MSFRLEQSVLKKDSTLVRVDLDPLADLHSCLLISVVKIREA